MSQPDDSYIEELFSLARFLARLSFPAGEVRTILGQALDRTIALSDGVGGAILFVGEEPIAVRQGSLEPAAALDQIETWELLVRQRLARGQWAIASVVDPDDVSYIGTTIVSVVGPTLLSAPLLNDNQVVGTLNLILEGVREAPHTVKHLLALLVGAVGSAAVSLEQRRRMQQGFNQLNTLHQVGRALGSTLELPKLLDEIMRQAAEVMEAEACSLWLVDERTDELVFEVAHGGKEVALRQYRMPMETGIAGWVAAHDEPVLSNDVGRNERFNPRVDVRTGYLTRSILCVPLRVKGKVIGVLEVLNKLSDEGFTASDQNLLSTLAAEAAIAIDSARLYRSLREERDKIVTAGEDVRRELARTLHDGPAQALAAINMRLEFIRKMMDRDPQRAAVEIRGLEHMVNETSRDVRNLLFELRPVVLEAQGLQAAVESFVSRLWRVGERPMFHLHLDLGPERLGPSIETTVFGVVQEAVNNALHHANAENVLIHLRREGDEIVATVRDDGVGFRIGTVETDYERRGSFGLLNMRERANLVNGKLTIHSAPGKGTEVTVCVPLLGGR